MAVTADARLDAAIDMVTVGAGSASMSRLLDIAAHVTAAPFAAVIMQRPGGYLLLAGRGFTTVQRGVFYPSGPDFDTVFDGARVVNDPARLATIKRASGLLPWAWVASVPVLLPGFEPGVALVCADTRPNLRRPDKFLGRLGLLASIVADQLGLLQMLATQGERIDAILAAQHSSASETLMPATGPMVPPLVAAPALAAFHHSALHDIDAPSASAVDFLSSTLISKTRLLRRGDLAYHAVRRWRAPLKQWQLAALKALKRTRDPLLVELAATELVAAAQQLYGQAAIGAVTAVPCGHSGPSCFASKLADAVARRLDVPAVTAFAPLDVTGSSHPRRNAARPRMHLRLQPAQSILLVDDVATSGAHMAEATRLLRGAAPAVFPLVWLADK